MHLAYSTCTESEYKTIMQKLFNKEVLLSNEIPPTSKIQLVRRTPRDEEEIIVKIQQESLGEPYTRGPSHR